MTGEELEAIVVKCLEEGVPPSVIARVFDLDAELVRAAQREVRVKNYGTDDMTEYMEQLQWESIDKARSTIASGSATERDRILSMVLGKQVALSARRTPESVRNSQGAILDLMENMRTGKAKKVEPKSKFVAVLENKEPEQSA